MKDKQTQRLQFALKLLKKNQVGVWCGERERTKIKPKRKQSKMYPFFNLGKRHIGAVLLLPLVHKSEILSK